jgi:hypothetical protein
VGFFVCYWRGYILNFFKNKLPLIKLQYASPPTALPIFNFRQYKGTTYYWYRQIKFIIFIVMTTDEFKNLYEFKLIKKSIMREFPFVKDIIVKDEDINKWSYNSYVEFVIDPYILSNIYNIKVWDIATKSLKRGEPFLGTSLSLFFIGGDDSNVANNIHKDMETLMDSIHKSPAIPQELKFNKKIFIGSYIAYPDSLPPFYEL